MSIPDFLPALVENTLDVLVVLEADGRFRYASPSLVRVAGWRPAEVVGTTVLTYVHPDDQATVAAVLADMPGNPGIQRLIEYRFRHQDGSWRWVQSLGASRLDDPRVQGIVFSVRDITDQRQLTERLLQTQRLDAIGRLAGGIAHDFNNILTAILGWSEFIVDRAQETEITNAALEIENGAERAADLTRQLLTFARRHASHPVILNVGTALRHQEAFLRRILAERHALTYQLESAVQIRIDANHFDQAVMNLVLNARDALPAGGNILLITRTAELRQGDPLLGGLAPGRYALIAVQDAGRGMTPEILAQACDPFFTTKTTGRCSGLGLSVVHGILGAAQGRLHLHSSPGVGTTATLVLPWAPGEPERPSAKVRTPLPSGGGGTVLVVEDDPGIRHLTEMLLKRAGYEVLTAPDGQAGLRCLLEHQAPIDLLITDMVMPHLDGPGLAAEARGVQPGLPVLFMSGYHEEALDRNAQVLDKPFTAASLLAQVRAMLGQRSR